MKAVWFLLFMCQRKSFILRKDCIDLLLITDDSKSHYAYIKKFLSLCVITQKIRIKRISEDITCSVLVVKKPWKNINKFV